MRLLICFGKLEFDNRLKEPNFLLKNRPRQ